MNPAALHITQPFRHSFILSHLDIVPERLAENLSPVLKLLQSLRVANQVWELATEAIVVLTKFVDFALLVALAAEVVYELSLGFVEAVADAMAKIAHRVELLHALAIVCCQHLFPLEDLLFVGQFLDSLVQL